nr:hypothetical protein BaRGS_028246 [Batillaria attramentaria]
MMSTPHAKLSMLKNMCARQCGVCVCQFGGDGLRADVQWLHVATLSVVGTRLGTYGRETRWTGTAARVTTGLRDGACDRRHRIPEKRHLRGLGTMAWTTAGLREYEMDHTAGRHLEMDHTTGGHLEMDHTAGRHLEMDHIAG